MFCPFFLVSGYSNPDGCCCWLADLVGWLAGLAGWPDRRGFGAHVSGYSNPDKVPVEIRDTRVGISRIRGHRVGVGRGFGAHVSGAGRNSGHSCRDITDSGPSCRGRARIRGPRFGIFQPRQSAGRNSGHSCRDITDSGPSCRDIPIPTQFQARIRGPSFVIFQPRISAGRNSGHSCRDIGSSCRDIHEQLFVIVCDWTPIKYCAGID